MENNEKVRFGFLDLLYSEMDPKHSMQNWSEVSRRLQMMTSQPYEPKRYLREAVELLVNGIKSGSKPETCDSVFFICPYIRRFEEGSLIAETQIAYPLAVRQPLDQIEIKSAVDLAANNFQTIDGDYVEDWICGHPAVYEEVVFLLREGRFCCLNSDGNPDDLLARELPLDYCAELLFETGAPWANGQYAHIRHPHIQSLRGKSALAAAGVYVVCQDWSAIRNEVLPRVRFLLVEFVSMLLLQAADEHYQERLKAEERMRQLQEESKPVRKAASDLVDCLTSASANIQYLQNRLHVAPAAILEIYRRPSRFIPPDEGSGVKFYDQYDFLHTWRASAIQKQSTPFCMQVACILLSYVGVEFPSLTDLPWPADQPPATELLRLALQRDYETLRPLFDLHTGFRDVVENWMAPQKPIPENEANIAEDVFELLKCIFCRPFHEGERLRAGLLAAWASRCRVARSELRWLLAKPEDRFVVPTKILRGLECLQAEVGTVPGIRPGSGSSKVTLHFPECSATLLTNAEGSWVRYSGGGESTEVPGSLEWAIWHLSRFRGDGLDVEFSRERRSIEVTF